jgi:hypothetical protein
MDNNNETYTVKVYFITDVNNSFKYYGITRGDVLLRNKLKCLRMDYNKFLNSHKNPNYSKYRDIYYIFDNYKKLLIILQDTFEVSNKDEEDKILYSYLQRDDAINGKIKELNNKNKKEEEPQPQQQQQHQQPQQPQQPPPQQQQQQQPQQQQQQHKKNTFSHIIFF